ncbi:MAG: hypothetical protein OIF47_17045 [Marinibacterium sp.]|nr:hypothetical protein [Marinibacterium sp.]
MRHMLCHILAAAVVVGSLPPVADALPVRAFERATVFATCAGRLEALAVHGRGHSRFDTAEADDLALHFAVMLDAVLPFALDEGVPEGEATKWRAGGWSEVAVLLSERDYSLDQARSDRAAERLRGRIADCTDLVMPGAAPDWVQSLSAPTQ